MRIRPERWGQLACLLAALGLLVSAWLFKLNHDRTDDIQQSRVVLSKQSCRQRNNERAVQRSNLRQSLAQLTKISDGALAQLGFTREQAVAQIHKQLRQVAPLDCKRLVHQVASNKTQASGGGGSGSSGIPRPPRTTASKPPTGPDDSPGASGPESPPEHGTPPPKPDQGGDGSVPPPNQGGGGDNGGVVNPPTTPDTPEVPKPDTGGLVQTIVNGVGDVVHKVLPPLGGP